MAHFRILQRASFQSVRRPRAEAFAGGPDWGASGWAGLGAGAAFILLQAASGLAFGGGGGAVVRRLAAVALGDFVLAAGAPLEGVVFFAAAAVHVPMSLICARVLTALIHGMGPARALDVGALFGAGLYAVNHHALSGLFPWLAGARGPAAFAAHVVFGVTTAAIYAALTPRTRGVSL